IILPLHELLKGRGGVAFSLPAHPTPTAPPPRKHPPPPPSPPPLLAWRTPAVIVICGCLIAILTFGPRSALGFFLTPLSRAHGWGRDVFAFALAIQNLLWGIGQPFAGAIADRFGTVRVLSAGALLYA